MKKLFVNKVQEFGVNIMGKIKSNKKTTANNQSFVGLEEPTMKLLLNPSASSGQARFGSFFNTIGLS